MNDLVGAMVRVKGEHLHSGRLVTIEDYVSAEDSEDGKPFYWASSQQGVNDVVLNVDDFDEAYSSAEVRARRPPTLARLAKALSSEVHGDWSDLVEIDETNVDEATIVCFGSTQDGLRLMIRLRVSSVQVVDF